MRAKRPFGHGIQLSGLYVGFKLLIPQPCIEFGEPVTELGEFLGGQLLNLPLKIFDFAHGISRLF